MLNFTDDSYAGDTFSTAVLPTLPLLSLSEDEKRTVQLLQANALRTRGDMMLAEAYYLGQQIVENLRIAVPAELEFLRTIVGWPAIAVDPLVERLFVDGFLLPGATDSDTRLAELWDANDGASEQSLAFTDALSMGHAYWLVGSPTEAGGAPQITVESPLNMSVLWDLRGTKPRAALQEYWADGRRHAALLLPNQTIHLATDDTSQWVVADRDMHDFGFVPIERMANRPRTNNRTGRSEITLALRNLTDSACRTLLGLEISREIYSVPGIVLLGATEADFQKTDGTPKSAWETYITNVLALERDEDGNLPDLKQKVAYDPSVFTKLIDMYASQAAGILASPPQDLGLYTDGNPVTAEAAGVAEGRRDRRAKLKWSMFGGPIVRTIQNAIRFQNKGTLPPEFARMAPDWRPVEMDSVAMYSTAIKDQVDAGAVPGTSDVVLKRLGYSAVERARLEQDRKRDDGRQAAKTIAAGIAQRNAQAGGNGSPAGL